MALPFISVVMVEPETPGNIGATARVMANFGFQELILVNPKCNHLSKESYDRASHGKYIIENAKIIYSLNNVFENFDYAIGTTCRVGTDYNILRSPLTPKQLAGKIASISSKANGKKPKIAILFGRESSGLTNNEIKKCDFIVTIPTPKDYPSMNISHAAAIMLYEIYFYSSKQPNTPLNYLPAGSTIEHFNPITRAEKKQIAKMVDEILN
ncbi:MAG: RNA methyltransferase, partial [Candidatus Woesearchaeota archaeon]|nr:RNA methyltransferase [Candidatus Woesearchaeota archaeon]